MRAVALSGGGRYIEYLEQELAERAYWQGIGARLLDLEGTEVQAHQAEALSRGIHPETGEVLRPRIQSRTMHDLIIRAPKAASILGTVDERVERAHQECVDGVRERVERLAGVHTRVGGEDEFHPTQNMVQAAFTHRTTREFDPDIHTHLVGMNMTYYPAVGEWRAIDATPIYRNQFEEGEYYRQKLAEILQGYGYELEARLVDAYRYPRVGEQYPAEVGFGIKGISPELEEKLSTRSQKIGAARDEYFEKHGRYPGERWTDEYVRKTRNPKEDLTRYTPEEIRERQLQKMSPIEREQLLRVRAEAGERQQIKPKLRLDDPGGYERANRVEDWTYGESPRMRV